MMKMGREEEMFCGFFKGWILAALVTVTLSAGCAADVPAQTIGQISYEQESCDDGNAGDGITFPVQTGETVTVPAWSGEPYTEVNGNQPFFTGAEITAESFESYSELDTLGRCGAAFACIGKDLMPTEERGAIGQVKPSGWHTVKYNGVVDGNYLYNRCHLIAYMLSGENANEKNLITGTRSMNIDGMLPFESQADDYVRETGNHLMYRVTPVFEGDNLVASGVLMEVQSVEDNGTGCRFCIFAYNAQPGIGIDYATGESRLAGSSETAEGDLETQSGIEYVLNTGSMKFHLPSCESAGKISTKNRHTYTGNREDLIADGYKPCGICKP